MSLLKDKNLVRSIQTLSKKDNLTNFMYLIRAYAVLAVVLFGTIWFYEFHREYGWSDGWLVPLTLFAVFAVGVVQHQLAGLAHEAIHHMLFKNRILNELISDFFCMFPIMSITYFFRLEHLGHHHFVNDTKRDPDITLLEEHDLWFDKPLNRKQLLHNAFKILSPLNLARYMLTRMRFAGMIQNDNPYWHIGDRSPILLNWSFPVYTLVLIVLNFVLIRQGDPWLLGLSQIVLIGGVILYYVLAPNDFFTKNRLKPVIPLRTSFILRLVWFSLLINSVAWIGFAFNSLAPLAYLLLLWFLPPFTTFSLLTILQQSVQHANADRGLLTNSCIMDLNPLANFCLFPASLGYHQAHHVFPAVPHFRVRKLHRELMKYPEYRNNVTITRGYLFPRMGPKKYPTVLEFLGMKTDKRHSDEIFIDPRVVKEDQIEFARSDRLASI